MINKIIEFCVNFFSMLIDLINWFFDGFVHIVSEIFYYFVDVFFSMIESIVNSVSFSSLTSSFGNWNILPPQIIYILSQLDITIILGMLASACLIRLTLNLVPGAFTRV